MTPHILRGDMSRSRVKVKGQKIVNFNPIYNFSLLYSRHFIFGILIYLMTPHILIGDMSWSRVKVKGQKIVNFNLAFNF